MTQFLIPSQFKLKVQTVDQTSLFELSWQGGLPIDARVPISSKLLDQYATWRRFYRLFYQTIQRLPGAVNVSNQEVRGKLVTDESLSVAPKDPRRKLVDAELELLETFHQWLRHPALLEIRDRLAQTSRELAKATHSQKLDLFLTFTDTDIDAEPTLARLPWEVWEIGSNVAPITNIRIARVPANIRQPIIERVDDTRRSSHLTWPLSRHFLFTQQKRPRILVILGDDTGLDLNGDIKAVQLLEDQADIQFVGWSGHKEEGLADEITEAIVDPRGWDVLLFAGHSNEMERGGGELAIAPNMSIVLNELKPFVLEAQHNGLQFALFNSCNGMDIAKTLIDWGLSQVAVMREPISNPVAQLFLTQFLQGLADHEDVHESLLMATEFLKSKVNLTYPSTYLIPTLFRHPQSRLFRIEPKRWPSFLEQWVPTRYEAIALGLCAVISLWPVAQNQLLDQRTRGQAQYRHWTQRVSSQPSPPVILVRIDGQSLAKDGVSDVYPMNQAYLAELIRKITVHNPTLIGVDYVLDRPSADAPKLAEAIEEAIAKDIYFVFATYPEEGKWLTISPDIAPDNPQSMDGDIRGWPNRVSLPHWYRQQPEPLAYKLAVLKDQQRLLNYPRTRRSIPTILSYNIGQQWFEPIIDFSIPPEQVYVEVPAWTLGDEQEKGQLFKQLQRIDPPIVLLVPGGYANAGIEVGEDNKPMPAAVQYWHGQSDRSRKYITGGELHAYRLHHFLSQRLVIPLPNITLVLIAAVLAKGVVLRWERSHSQEKQPHRGQWIGWCMAGTLIYGIVSLELYLSPVAILVPIALPALVFWLDVFPVMLKPQNSS